MEDAFLIKKKKVQEQTEEGIEVKLTEKNLDQHGFQVQLEDPQQATTS